MSTENKMTLDVSSKKTDDGQFYMVAKNHAILFEVTKPTLILASSELEKRVLDVIGPVFKVEFERDKYSHLKRVNVRKHEVL